MANKFYISEAVARKLSKVIPFVEKLMKTSSPRRPVKNQPSGEKVILAKFTNVGPE